MLKSKHELASDGFDTIIGKNTYFEGNLNCDGSVRIDGKVKGDIKVKGDVLLGKEGNVNGNILAVNISLSGTIEGNLEAKGVLKIMSSAKLYGDVLVKSFVADEGSLFQGNCKMIEAPVPEKDLGKKTVIKEIYEEKDKNRK